MLNKKKIIKNSLSTNNANRPDTVTRAGITARLQFTRGKQLVEHSPFSLLPDPHNPRPGEVIDENWLRTHLHLGTDQSLCKISSETGAYEIPEYAELNLPADEKLEESYNFLRELAYSIRLDGLIEPIEIFLADRVNDPDYFANSDLEYGYVILEGHQRRLAGMMSGVDTLMCIEITDESMLVKLKLKHRKLRRQLSENNLRKGITVGQNFQIVKELLSDPDTKSITNKELSKIIGLNESIASALKSICINPSNYPQIFFTKILDDQLTFKTIRSLVPKTYKEIEDTLNSKIATPAVKSMVKTRGKQGGASKKYATFKVRDPIESNSLQKLLLSRFPEIQNNNLENNDFKNLENLLNKIKNLALEENV